MQPTVSSEMDRIYAEFYEDRLSREPRPLAHWIAQYPEMKDDFVCWAADISVFSFADRQPSSAESEARTIEIGMKVLRTLGFQIEDAKELEAINSLYEIATQLEMKPKHLAQRLGMSITLAAKLERRLIQAASIPQQVIDKTAAVLSVTSDQIKAYFALPPALAAGAAYKSEEVPTAGAQESFSKAVLNCSDMDAAQKAGLLDGALPDTEAGLHG